MRNYCFINKRFVEAKDANISVFDRGLRYGDGVFETIRSYRGDPLFLKE
ncbi:MAG: hypothetical protein HY880_03280, partial [Deltaproteobacteria bacterium]|nr:hypothetical protein [Deltaproteobacteria bacterium]